MRRFRQKRRQLGDAQAAVADEKQKARAALDSRDELLALKARAHGVARAALYLALSAAGFVSGKVIEVDGGMAALPGTAIEAKIPR